MPPTIRPLEMTAARSSSFPFLLRRDVMAEMLRDQFDQGLADQPRLAGAGYPRDSREHAKGNATSSPARLLRVTPARRSQSSARARLPRRERAFAEQEAPCLRGLDLSEPFRRTAIEHKATLLAGAGTHIDDPVG